MRRVVTFRFWRHTGWKLASIPAVVAILFTGAAIWRGHNTPDCQNVNALNDALVTILNRSKVSLAGNGYYRKHPAQLALAQAQSQQALDDLDSARC